MVTNRLRNRLLKLSRELIHCIPFQSKHFSYILCRNDILSVGYNTSKTSPLADKLGYYRKMKFGLHSEIHAIINFPYENNRLKKCKLINIRIGADGSLKMSKPCPICQNSLDEFGIHDIIYTDGDGNFQEIVS